jgi:hypothetical protein
MPLDVDAVHRRADVQRGRLAAAEALGRSRPLRVAWAVAAAALFATYLGAVGRSSVAASARGDEERVASIASDPSAMVCRDDCVRQPCMSVAASIDWSRHFGDGRRDVGDDGSPPVCLRALSEPANASLVSVTFTPARP